MSGKIYIMNLSHTRGLKIGDLVTFKVFVGYPNVEPLILEGKIVSFNMSEARCVIQCANGTAFGCPVRTVSKKM